MSNVQFNINTTNKVPIHRNNLFYSDNDFNYEMNIGRNYLEQDVNQSVILYEVDLEKSNLDTLYNETKVGDLVFKVPVELHVLYNIEQSELRAYEKSNNMGVYVKGGKLSFGVYQSTLDELNADIKIGDYIGIQVTPTHREYYTVTNDGRNNFDNAHSVFGTKPSWRTITCAYVDNNELNTLWA